MLGPVQAEPILKEHYSDFQVKNETYNAQPTLAILPKMEGFGGKVLPIPIQYGTNQAGSADFSTGQALAATRSNLYTDFYLTRVKDYSFADIDNETMEATRGDINAFINVATREIDGTLHTSARSAAINLFRNGLGSRGQCTATFPSANSMQLTIPDEIVGFEVGMSIQFSTTDGGAVVAGAANVVAVNRDTGVITFGTGELGGLGIVTGTQYFLYRAGDAANGGARKCLSGFDAWIPGSTPSATPFFGVDRTVDPTRLAGIRYDGTSETIAEALISASSRGAREEAFPDFCVMNQLALSELIKTLGSNVVYDRVKSYDMADISFKSVTLYTTKREINVVADSSCPPDRAYMLTLNSWKLYSLGTAPRIFQQDGLMMLRNPTSDSAQVRCGWYANLGCDAPGQNIRVALATGS